MSSGGRTRSCMAEMRFWYSERGDGDEAFDFSISTHELFLTNTSSILNNVSRIILSTLNPRLLPST